MTKSGSGVSHQLSAMAVRVQDGLWRRSSFEGASSNDRRSSNEGGRSNDRPPELDAVDTLFEEALGGCCVEGEEKESPDIDAFEYMPQGLRLSYSLRTARTRVDSLSTSSHRHGQGL